MIFPDVNDIVTFQGADAKLTMVVGQLADIEVGKRPIIIGMDAANLGYPLWGYVDQILVIERNGEYIT